MARIRSIKPSFFTSEHVAGLSMAARLLYVGLWTLSDREGRLEDRPRRIKVELFGYDDLDVDGLLAELAAGADPFIERYEVDGRGYIQVLSFADHQKPHPKEPTSVIPASREKTRRAVEKHGEPRKGLVEPELDHVEPGGSMVYGSMVSGSMVSGGGVMEPRPAPLDGCFYTKAENDAWAAATGQKLGHDRPAPVQSRGVSDPGRHQTKCHGFGTLPSCARGLCIPAFLGQEWVDQVGSAGVEYVAQFVADVVHGTPDGPVGDPLKFWRSAWDAKHRAAKDRPALMRAGSMDWADECAARHGGACPSQYQHGLKMQREQGRTA